MSWFYPQMNINQKNQFQQIQQKILHQMLREKNSH